MLESALAARKIKIVHWFDQRGNASAVTLSRMVAIRAALFPPNWCAHPGERATPDGLSLLLDFSELQT